MSEESRGGGFLGALFTAAGVGSVILLPFYLVWRFGIAHIAGMLAPLATVIAIYRADWLTSVGYEQASMLHSLLSMPWTAISVTSWVFYALCLLAVVTNSLPPILAGRASRK
ncbi:hypothetical protein PCA31118_05082 [Pandoraea captiosa]|uniref:Uncharacterized protein n=1 Tax=Pandoraea captiosa TaxID=2508302 RepID=A0A5E5AR32_9BURK|nr:hypothetical protein [Pandoraea captiosa]VVE75874.1 hypothetical protein PCA31118_05082 [Pandoraea captiosa]